MSFWNRLGIRKILFGDRLDDAFFENLEEALLEADAGFALAAAAVADLRKACDLEKIRDPAVAKKRLRTLLKSAIPAGDFRPSEKGLDVWVLLGVNGAGKTTTTAKLTRHFEKTAGPVLIGACDTYRAAAKEQIEVWGERLGVPVIGAPAGSDAASVAFDAVQSALARGCRTCLLDTAGRLHTKEPLLDQLGKLVRVVDKHPGIRRRNLLVLDATQGQAAVDQAKIFASAAGVDGLVVTKVDTGAKGGTLLGIGKTMNLPVAFLGYGESPDDLAPFEVEAYLDTLF